MRLIPAVKLRKLLLWTSVLSLMAMVVLLGAAAKHSQFGHSGSGSHYLSKSIKMTQTPAEDSVSVIAPLAVFAGILGIVGSVATVGVPVLGVIPVRSFIPLLL